MLWSLFLLVPDEDMSLRAFRWLRVAQSGGELEVIG